MGMTKDLINFVLMYVKICSSFVALVTWDNQFGQSEGVILPAVHYKGQWWNLARTWGT